MAITVNPLEFDIRPREGSCFTISGDAAVDTANPVPGKLNINLTNSAGKWIKLVVEGFYPSWTSIWPSGELQDSQSANYSTQLQYYTGWTIKFTRWAPGFLGIPGNAGGEAYVTLPNAGDVTINVTVTS